MHVDMILLYYRKSFSKSPIATRKKRKGYNKSIFTACL